MNKKLLPFLLVLLIGTAMKSDKNAYQFFDLKGKKADYQDVLKAVSERLLSPHQAVQKLLLGDEA